MYIKLLELGFDPYIVGMRYKKSNISFILNNVKVKLINNSYKEITKNEFDILIVNSDQTWRKTQNKHFYDVAFLRFAKIGIYQNLFMELLLEFKIGYITKKMN